MIELQLLNDLDGLDDIPGGGRQRVRGRNLHAVNCRLHPLTGLFDAEIKSHSVLTRILWLGSLTFYIWSI
jgi:hypothetical protein